MQNATLDERINEQTTRTREKMSQEVAKFKTGKGGDPFVFTDAMNNCRSMLDEIKADSGGDDLIDSVLAVSELAQAYNAAYPHPTGRKAQPDKPGAPIPSGFDGRRSVDIASRITSTADFLATDPGSLDDGGFDGLGDFLNSIRRQRGGEAHDERLKYSAVGQNVGSDPAGGFLVPEFFQREIIQTATDAAPWLGLLDRSTVPEGYGSVRFPILADRDQSGEDIGGGELSRVAETGQIPLSTLQFEAVKSELYKAATRVRTSNELLTDNGVSMENALRQQFANMVTLRQSLDVLGGTGVGEPLGLAVTDSAYKVAKESMQTAATINGDNVLKMDERLSPAARSRAIWLAHPSVKRELIESHSSLSNSDITLFAPGNGLDVPDTLLGRPIYFTAGAKILGTKGDLVLFNPMTYVYMQKPLRIDVSPHFRFDYDETEFRVVLRDDGMPKYQSTFTDAQGYESSEIVTLATRA